MIFSYYYNAVNCLVKMNNLLVILFNIYLKYLNIVFYNLDLNIKDRK